MRYIKFIIHYLWWYRCSRKNIISKLKDAHDTWRWVLEIERDPYFDIEDIPCDCPECRKKRGEQ